MDNQNKKRRLFYVKCPVCNKKIMKMEIKQTEKMHVCTFDNTHIDEHDIEMKCPYCRTFIGITK